MKIVLVILAAGESTRLGRCKALLPLGQHSAIEHLLAASQGVFEGPTLVISGAHDLLIREHLRERAEVLTNSDWRRGRSSGVRLAHEHSPGEALCIAPVDCPLVPRAVFVALHEAFGVLESKEHAWLAPRTALTSGRLRDGHPVLLGPGLLAELKLGNVEPSLRELRERARPRLSLPVDSPEIHDNLDRLEDWRRLQARFC